MISVHFLRVKSVKSHHPWEGRTAASIFAGLSMFGSANMETTEIKIFSTDCTGDQRSVLLS